jgi:hypothetical protein
MVNAKTNLQGIQQLRPDKKEENKEKQMQNVKAPSK